MVSQTKKPVYTQEEANTAFYKWIDINTNSIEGVADALGLSINIENDNNEIIIEIDPNNDGILDVSNKFDKGDGDLEYETAVILGQAVKKNEGEIATNKENITINANKFNELLLELNLIVNDEGNIVPGPPDPNNPLDISSKFDKGAGTTTLNDATVMEAEIGKNTDAITKNTNSITDISSNIGGSINIDGTINFPDDVETDLSKLATKQEREQGDEANAVEIASLSNRLDALENTSLSAEWTIAKTDGTDPAEGELSLNNAAWASVTVLKFSTKDKGGTEHNFTSVKEGDTIQIGVGASGRAAGSSAAYTVESATGGEFSVTHLASTGTPSIGFTAVVAVYPAFDPSNYATVGELDAVKTDKLSKGDGLKAATAKVLEDRIDTNEGSITTNATNISTNATNIEANKTSIENVIEVIGGNVDTDGNITLPDPIDIDSKLDKGTGLAAKDAKELEDAIGTNATNIDANKENINNLVVNIGGTVDPDTGVIIELPNGGDPIDISGIVGLERVNFLGNYNDFAEVVDPEIGDTFLKNSDYIFYTWVGDKWVVNFHYSDWTKVQEINSQVDKNASNITNISNSLGGTVDGNGNITIDKIDALPDQTDAEGKYLSSVAGEAVWAEIDIPDALPDGGKEGDVLSLDADGDAIWAEIDIPDVDLNGYATEEYVDAADQNLQDQIDALGDELGGVVTPVGTATYNVKQSGAAESGDAVTSSLNPAVIAQITFGLVDANGKSTNFAGVSTGDTLKIDNNKGATGEHTIVSHYMVSRSVQLDSVQGPNGEWIQRWTTEPVHYVMQLQDGSGEGTLTEGETVEFSILGVGEGRAVSAEYVDAQDAKKFDVAGLDEEGPLALTNARTMERAIAQTIGSLGWEIEINAEGEVTIKPPGGGDTESLADKLSRGTTKYNTAEEIEKAIDDIQGFETLKFVGSVETLDKLPSPLDEADMLYYVESEKQFYASNGESWIALSNFGITADEIADLSNQIAKKFDLRDVAGNEPQFYNNAALVEKDLIKKDSQLTMLVTAFGYKWDYNDEGDLVLLPIDPEGGGGVEDNILAAKFDKGTSEDNELSYADAYHMGVAIDEAALKVSTLEGKVESLETNTPEGLATEEYVDNALIPYAKQEDLTLLAAEVELKATLMHVTQAEYDNLMNSDSIDKNTLYVVSA